MSLINKILLYLPSYPHFKMNIFSGTNSFDEIKQVIGLLNSSEIIQGKAIEQYRKILKKKLYTNDIYTFASGRMGFYSILKTVGIQEGDEIIIPSYTCVVVPNAILYAGGKPIYCDINEKDFNIDITKIEAHITSKTKVLYAQHTFGQMCDIDSIVALAKKYNLIVIEDAALALGAHKNGRYAGTIGDFGYFSTDRSKVINTGLGGIVALNNEKYAQIFKSFYDNVPYLDIDYTKKIAKTFLINIITLHPSFYWFGKFLNAILSRIGLLRYFLDENIHQFSKIKGYPYPARLSNIFASIGISQVKALDSNLAYRKNVVKYYNNILGIYTDRYIEDDTNIFLRYSFLVKNREYWEKRFSSKIDLSIWFKTIASGKEKKFEDIGYIKGSNKISEYVCQHIFNLPTHQNIDPKQLEKLLIELKNSGDIITKEKIL